LGYQLLRAQSVSGRLVCALLPATLVAMLLTSLRTPKPNSIVDSGCRQAYQYVRDYPGKSILSENPGAVVMAGKSSPVFEPFLWTRQVVDKDWPDTEIVNLIRSRQIDLIVLGSLPGSRASQVRWSNSVREAIEQNYQPTRVFACPDARLAYQPKGLGH
jgi:hypothetical protein